MGKLKMMTMTLSSNCVRSNMDAFRVALNSMYKNLNNKLFCVNRTYKNYLMQNYCMNYKRISISC